MLRRPCQFVSVVGRLPKRPTPCDEASPYHDAMRARDGALSVPDGPGLGLGLEPDAEVLDRYRLGPAVVIGA